MRRIEEVFEERTARMAPMLQLPSTVSSVKQQEEVAFALDTVEEQEAKMGSQVIKENMEVSPRVKKVLLSQPERRSKRGSDDGMTVQARAQQVKAQLNLSSGMRNNPFAFFANIE